MRNLASAAVVALLLAVPFGFTPASSATNEQAITSLPSGALPISDYYNQSVYDNQDNKVGDVNDLLVDKDGKIGAAIVGVGGFLGAGEKNVAVPPESVQAEWKDNAWYLTLNATKDALKAAPGMTFEKTKSAWIASPK